MKDVSPNLQRFIAFFIDLFIKLGITLGWVMYISKASTIEQFMNTLLWIIIFSILSGFLIDAIITPLLISEFGGSLGKILVGIEIVNTSGKRLSYWKAVFRNYIGYIISGIFLCLGFIWILIDKDHRGWHDLISDTYVKLVRKSGWIIGLLSLTVIMFVNIFVLSLTIQNFSSNKQIYTDLFGEVSTSIQQSLKNTKTGT